jgi:hypothetical protein
MEITTYTPAITQPRLAMPSVAFVGRVRDAAWAVKHNNVPGVPVWSPPHC